MAVWAWVRCLGWTHSSSRCGSGPGREHIEAHPISPLEGGLGLDTRQAGSPRKWLGGRLLIARLVSATQELYSMRSGVGGTGRMRLC